MTESEAIELAAKREKHKSKHLSTKVWKAVHNSVKGWHVVLVDNRKEIIRTEKTKAQEVILNGNSADLVDAPAKILMSRVMTSVERFDHDVVSFYLKLSKNDDDKAEQKTCKKFNISEDTLNMILMSDFVNSHTE